MGLVIKRNFKFRLVVTMSDSQEVFYDEDGNLLTPEEVQELIESGDLEVVEEEISDDWGDEPGVEEPNEGFEEGSEDSEEEPNEGFEEGSEDSEEEPNEGFEDDFNTPDDSDADPQEVGTAYEEGKPDEGDSDGVYEPEEEGYYTSEEELDGEEGYYAEGDVEPDEEEGYDSDEEIGEGDYTSVEEHDEEEGYDPEEGDYTSVEEPDEEEGYDPEEGDYDPDSDEDAKEENPTLTLAPELTDLGTESTVINRDDVSERGKVESNREASSSIVSQMDITSDSFEATLESIRIDSILTPKFKKSARSETAVGLSGLVKDLSVLTPISVYLTASYAKAEKEGTADSFMGPKYIVLDGLRRMYGAVKNRKETIPALVYRFDDIDKANEAAAVLGLIINKGKAFTWSEAYNMGTALEQRGILVPKDIDTLLNLNPGEWMKLKDIALADMYPEIWEDLIAKKKGIDQAYNALQKLRKEEDQASLEDAQGVEGMGEASDFASGDNTGQLNKEEVDSILELSDKTMSFSEEGEEVEAMFGEATGELQDTKNRKPLDPILRGKILARDDYSCQCCGFGKGMQGTNIAAMQLAIHHVISVYIGAEGGASTDDEGMIAEGSDVPRLLTVCEVCHHAIHNLVGTQGKLGMTKEAFAKLPEHEASRWRSISKYAQILLEAERKVGKHLKQSVPTKLPRTPFWEARDANMEAIASINKPEILNNIEPLPAYKDNPTQGTADDKEASDSEVEEDVIIEYVEVDEGDDFDDDDSEYVVVTEEDYKDDTEGYEGDEGYGDEDFNTLEVPDADELSSYEED